MTAFLCFTNSFKIFVFNLVKKIYHQVSEKEITLIKETGLFKNLPEKKFQLILNSIKLVRYQKNKLIFLEGDLPDGLYLVKEGAVRVFSYDMQGQKIPLARLNEGDYFGEQALLGQGSKTRNANVETILDTTLIKIHKKDIALLWEEDKKLVNKLKKIGYKQAIKVITSSIKIYKDLLSSIEQVKKKDKENLTEFESGQIIFNVGDLPDNCYLILQGTVELIIGNKKILLHRGQLFGELGVLENKPRMATAIAKNYLLLLVIKGDQFKDIHRKSPYLQNLLKKLKQTYALPQKGFVKQYVGELNKIGTLITNVFSLDDGRTITSTLAIDLNVFTMWVANQKPAQHYKFSRGAQHVIELAVYKNYLVEIKSYGDCPNLPEICQFMFDNKMIPDFSFEQFSQTGKLAVEEKIDKNQEIVCECMSVTRDRLSKLIENGMNSIDDLSKETGASTVCRGCRYKILEMLGQGGWMPALMEQSICHNDHVYSYLIKPTSIEFLNQFKNFLPGQYIIIQVKVFDHWIERPYTISGWEEDKKALRVTIKKEPKGLFTSWLFEQAPKIFSINLSSPQGHFLLDMKNSTIGLCFAGGIGVTPFVAYAKALVENHLNKKIVIVYCANNREDLVFRREFDEFAREDPFIKLLYWQSDLKGFLTEKDIMLFVNMFAEPDIYICGHPGFQNLICQVLQNQHYRHDKIQIEQFTYAGSA